jgi:integrase
LLVVGIIAITDTNKPAKALSILAFVNSGDTNMPLTDTNIRNAKYQQNKPIQKLSDGHGLHLMVTKTGKYWRYNYRFDGKQKTLAIGTYPETSLADARGKHLEARKQLAAGIDPGELKKAVKAAQVEDANTFEVIAREWHGKFSPNWTKDHVTRIFRRFENSVFPYIGKRPIKDINAPELLTVLRRIEARGAVETAHRAMQNCGQVFRYAVATGRTDRDPSADLRGALPPVKQKHHASITDTKKIGELLRAMDGYQGTLTARCALSLAPLVFVRPGELRAAEWQEIDFDKAEWRIPGEKMKMGAVHIVPLSRQVVAILEEIKPLTGDGRYVFPSERSKDRPISENTVNAALRRMGYSKAEMTGHGFRSMASTLLNEQGWHRDAIERQLAHAERDNVRAAYNYAEHLPERRRMMQAWSDYLDGLKKGADVIPIRKAI